jgi:hypothetical protein
MKKLITTLLGGCMLFTVLNGGHAEGLTKNEKDGCMLIGATVITRIEEFPKWEADCGALKAKLRDPLDCTLIVLMTRNRVRGLPDLDVASIDVRKNVVKACFMFTKDVTEEVAQAATRAVK